MGIGTKILSGFMALIIIGVVIGGAGYLSLERVIRAADLNEAANQVRAKIFEARSSEKDFIIKKDKSSYQRLLQNLSQLTELTATLKGQMDQSHDADEISAAREVYQKSAAELKKLEEEDASALNELQRVAGGIAAVAQEESSRAAAKTKENILQTSAQTLKEYAFERIKDVVGVGYDVLKFYHETGQSKEAALKAIRNLHFEDNNYFFVVQEDLTLVAHGSNQNLEGQDFGKIQDKKTGKTFMRELVDSALRSGASYTEYFWNKPGMGDAVFPKVTYARSFKPWGLVICAGTYIDDLEKQTAKTGQLIEDGLARLQQANAIMGLIDKARLNALYYFAFGENAEKVAENLTQLKALPTATDALRKDADSYQEKFTRRVKNSETRQGNIAGIDEAAGRAEKTAKAVGEAAVASFSKIASSGKWLIVVFIIVGAGLGLAGAAILTRAIIKPVKWAISGLDEASSQVTAAAGQVSSASQQLAEGASEQAASLEETSSALEEITSMTKQNAENATQANRLMADSSSIVERANGTMAALTLSMSKISEASEETQKIIKTIDEIAFQTNLLALNAAVEAARAGEAGAGFAVVADEVRNLALRAADAAKNTSTLIEGTVIRVQEGNVLVDKTNADFQEVSSSVAKSGELVGEIAAASQEQAQGIGQVNTAVAEMDKVVQQNAANAEESASASEEMRAQAEQLKSYVAALLKLIGGSGQGRQRGGPERLSALVAMVSRADPSRGAKGPIGRTDKDPGWTDEAVRGKEISSNRAIRHEEGDLGNF